MTVSIGTITSCLDILTFVCLFVPDLLEDSDLPT